MDCPELGSGHSLAAGLAFVGQATRSPTPGDCWCSGVITSTGLTLLVLPALLCPLAGTLDIDRRPPECPRDDAKNIVEEPLSPPISYSRLK